MPMSPLEACCYSFTHGAGEPQFSVAMTAQLSEEPQSALDTGAVSFLSPKEAEKNQAKMSQGRPHYQAEHPQLGTVLGKIVTA